MIHWYLWNDGFTGSLYFRDHCWYCWTSMWIQFSFTTRMWILGCTGLHATALNAALLEHFNLPMALPIMYTVYFHWQCHYTFHQARKHCMAPHKAVSSDLQRAYWDRYSDIATPVEVRHAHTTQFVDTQQKKSHCTKWRFDRCNNKWQKIIQGTLTQVKAQAKGFLKL